MTLINNQPGKRGLTEQGRWKFQAAYESACIFEATQPLIRFSRPATGIIRQVSELRRKDWQSTSRWNEAADFTGLIGELAVQRYLGVSPALAVKAFLDGLQGDTGHDVEAAGLKLDCKATKGHALKFKFSKRNPHAHRADGFIFTYVEEGALETRVHLLGWAHRADVKPHLRDDGYRYFVRAETLRREGVLKSVSLLKRATPETLSTPVQPVH